jgi:hypothetical protein
MITYKITASFIPNNSEITDFTVIEKLMRNPLDAAHKNVMVDNRLSPVILGIRKILSLKEISKLFLCPTLRPTSRRVNVTTVLLCMMKYYY